jgi:hypothetical protein
MTDKLIIMNGALVMGGAKAYYTMCSASLGLFLAQLAIYDMADSDSICLIAYLVKNITLRWEFVLSKK